MTGARKVYGVLLAVLWLGGGRACGTPADPAATNGLPPRMMVDGVAACVGKEFITVGDVLGAIASMQRQLTMRYRGAELKQKLETLFKDGVEQLVERALILQSYEDQDRKLEERVIEQRVDELAGEWTENRSAALEEGLIEERMTPGEWRDTLRKDVIVSFMRQAHIDRNIQIPPGTAYAYFAAHKDEFRQAARARLGVILLQELPGKPPRDERSAAVMAALEDGQEFAGVARAHSDDARAAQGGEWGWIAVDDLRPALREGVAGLEAGAVSDPIPDGDSLYVVKVYEKDGGVEPAFETVREAIERILRRKAREETTTAWVAQQKRKTYVKVLDVPLF